MPSVDVYIRKSNLITVAVSAKRKTSMLRKIKSGLRKLLLNYASHSTENFINRNTLPCYTSKSKTVLEFLTFNCTVGFGYKIS